MVKILGYIMIAPIWLYQKLISPFFHSTCRFNPTCSHYAIDAIKLKGPFVGFWLALKRISKCHPWGGTGYDPLP
ncbi:membrane protein insertion efficiency factor YidD [Flavobacteriales bacterium]|nr:membrane protein insertion efficiency factor YidD [Flavobacteriales bacterium]